MAKHLVKHWRGSRASYNYLRDVSALDPWMRYSVVNEDGSISEYFGENKIYQETGQLIPVSAIVTTAPQPEDAEPYDRYLVGDDENGYKIIEYTPRPLANGGYELVTDEMDFDWKYGVRVKSMGLKNYIYVDGHLVTYDDVDCGIF